MLIQITNKCSERCRHCLHASSLHGKDMSKETFRKAVEFGYFLGVSDYVISGGEPTEHEDMLGLLIDVFEEFYKNAPVDSVGFAVCSNGTWWDDPIASSAMRRATALKHFRRCQIYSNKKWYQDYENVKAHAKFFATFPNTFFDEEPIFMQDLGRARTDPDAQEEVERNPYECSCANALLARRQMRFPRDWGKYLNPSHRLPCHPLVGWNGDVHMSESCLCPSVGNVNDDPFPEIWRRMREEKPCMGCQLSQKLKHPANAKETLLAMMLGV